MRVFEALAKAFLDEEVDTVFSLMGDANMFWLGSLVAGGEVRNIHARHENAAVGMADGYARATGKVGVAALTSGPGLTQVATALTGAARYGVPMVVFAGDTSLGDLSSTQRIDHATFAQLCGVHREAITSPVDCLDRVSAAFYRATALRQPVLLSVPMDVQELELADYAYTPSTAFRRHADASVPSPEALDRAAGLILSAQRPVVILGEGAVRGGAVEAALRLGDRIGAVFATTLLAKGAADASPWSVGISGTFASDRAVEIIAAADLVIGVGASLNDFTSVGGGLFRNARVVQILDRPHAVAVPGRDVDCYLQGDARVAVEALSEFVDLAGHSGKGMRDRVEPRGSAATSDHEDRSDDSGLDPRTAVRIIDEQLPDDAIVVCGAGHFWSFVIRGLVGGRGRRYLFTLGFGSIGQALPVAVGAAIGRPDRPVVVIEGDSSILLHPQELDTAARHRAGLLAVVLDDDAMGAEVHKLAERGFDPEPACVPTPDLALMATAFGADGFRFDTAGELEAALAARDWGSLGLFDIKISRSVVDVDGVKGGWRVPQG